MPFKGIAHPQQLAVLTSVFDAICLEAGIGLHCPEREEVAALVMRLYWDGCRTLDEFRATVDEATIDRG